MNVDVLHEGVSIKDHVISYDREHKVCTGIGSANLIISMDVGRTFTTWDTISIYENGTLQCKYYISDIQKEEPSYTIKLTVQDLTKRLTDYFISDTYYIDYPSTVGYWIDKFLNEAGIPDGDIIWNTDKFEGNWLSNNTSLGMQGAYEQLMMLLQTSGWFMYFTGDEKCVIGELEVDFSNYNVTINKTDFTDISVIKHDKMLRNRVVVWGGGDSITGTYVYEDYTKHTPYDYGPNDQRTIVIANSNIRTGSTAKRLADTALKEFARITVEKHITLIGARDDIALGDVVYVNSDIYSGSGLVTTYGVSMSDKGLVTNIVLDERCPRLFGYFDFGGYVYAGTQNQGVHRKLLKYWHGWTDFSTGLPEDDLTVTDLHINGSNLVAITAGSGIDPYGKAYYSSGESLPWKKIELPTTLYSSGDDVTFSGYSQGYGTDTEFTGPFSARACIIDRDTNIIKLAVDNSSGVYYTGDWRNINSFNAKVGVESGWRGWIVNINPTSLDVISAYPVSLSGDYSWWLCDIECDSRFDYVTAWRPPVDYDNVYQKYKWYSQTDDRNPDPQANTYFPMGATYTSTDITRWFSGTGINYNFGDTSITDYSNTHKWAGVGGTSEYGQARLFVYEEGQSVRYVTLNGATLHQKFDVYERPGGVYVVVFVGHNDLAYWIINPSDTEADVTDITDFAPTYDTQSTYSNNIKRGHVLHHIVYWGMVEPGDPIHIYYTRFDLNNMSYTQWHQQTPVQHGNMIGYGWGALNIHPYGGYDEDGAQFLGWIYCGTYEGIGEYWWMYGTPETGVQFEIIDHIPYAGGVYDPDTIIFDCATNSGNRWDWGHDLPQTYSLNSEYAFCAFTEVNYQETYYDAFYQDATFGIHGKAPLPCDWFNGVGVPYEYQEAACPQYYPGQSDYALYISWETGEMRSFSVPSMELINEVDYSSDYDIVGSFTRPEANTGAHFLLASKKTGSGNGALLIVQKGTLQLLKEIDLGASVWVYWDRKSEYLQNAGGYFVASHCGIAGIAFKVDLSAKAITGSGAGFVTLARRKNDEVKDDFTQIDSAVGHPIWLDVSNYAPLMTLHGTADTFTTNISDDSGITQLAAPVTLPFQSMTPLDMRYTSLEIGNDIETRVLITSSGGIYTFDPLTFDGDLAIPTYTPGSGITASGTINRVEATNFIPSGQYIFCSLNNGASNEFYQKDPENDFFFATNYNLPTNLVTIIRVDDRI